MEYHVFNKRPSKSAVEKASQYKDAKEQKDELALATFPEKGELWQNENTGRLVVIKSHHINVQGAPVGCPAIDEFGVIVSDVINGEEDFDIFFALRQLLQYKKVGRLKKKLGAI